MLARINGVKGVSFLAAILVVALIAVACGDDEEAPPPLPTPTSGTVAAPTATSAPGVAPTTAGVPTTECVGDPELVKAQQGVVTMTELSNSEQIGCALLTQVERETEVVIDITAGPSGDDPQSAKIYEGRCPPGGDLRFDLGVKYELEDVVAGKSTTSIDVPFSILRFGQFAVVVSTENVIMSCGNVPSAFEG